MTCSTSLTASRARGAGFKSLAARHVQRAKSLAALVAIETEIVNLADLSEPLTERWLVLRHTYATWMRRFASADLQALLGTNRKSIPASVPS